MYLPVILLRRYGWTGFAIFAVTNVLGCAGMGYVLKTRERSQIMVKRHGTAGAWFSSITIGFHLLFAVLFIKEVGLPLGDGVLTGIGIALGMYVVGWLFGLTPVRIWPVLAALVYAVSIAALVSTLQKEHVLASLEPTDPVSHIWMLAPVIAFGFALCPYLDLTFHLALQKSPSKHAFGVFGVTFAVMICLTCFMWFENRSDGEGLSTIVIAHLVSQMLLTVSVHCGMMRKQATAESTAMKFGLFGTPLLLIAIAAIAMVATDSATWIQQSLYLRMLVFYSLAFPLYCWMFVGPGRCWELHKRTVMFCLGGVLILAPLYEAGFLHERPWYTLVAAVVLVAMKFGTARNIETQALAAD